VANKKKIVIVDDEPEICELTKSILERTGRFEVFTSTRAKEALGLVKFHKPEIILLDVMMPEMSGVEVAQSLCENEETKGVKIVFVTAIAVPMLFLSALMENEALKQKAGPSGGHYFIQKPISPPELIQRLDEILAKNP
jgi:CheY-like chemotaxis protein